MKYMIEITTRCNLRCPHCEHTYWKEKARDMPFEEFKKILDAFVDCTILDISGIGEAMCHPEFNRILEYACQKVPVVEFTTNLQVTPDREFVDIVQRYRPRINLSWEGCGKECYEKSRVGGTYEKLLGNIDLLPRDMITINYLVTKITYGDVFKFAEMARNIGFKSVRFSLMAPFKENSHLMLNADEMGVVLGELKKISGIEFSLGGFPVREINGCPFITVDGYIIKPPFGAYVTQSNDREKMIETYGDFNIIHRIAAIRELQRYTGLGGNVINGRMAKANGALTDHWNALNPKSGYERDQFYRTDENWIFDLMGWGRPMWLEKIRSRLPPKARILDFGCGVGDFVAGLAQDYQVEYIDVPGAITTQFLKWRLKDRKLEAKEIGDMGKGYDAILCFDVFEHLPNPIRLLKTFSRRLKPKGLLFITTGFHDYRPMHIYHDEGAFRKALRERFECVDPNRCEVWRLK